MDAKPDGCPDEAVQRCCRLMRARRESRDFTFECRVEPAHAFRILLFGYGVSTRQIRRTVVLQESTKPRDTLRDVAPIRSQLA